MYLQASKLGKASWKDLNFADSLTNTVTLEWVPMGIGDILITLWWPQMSKIWATSKRPHLMWSYGHSTRIPYYCQLTRKLEFVVLTFVQKLTIFTDFRNFFSRVFSEFFHDFSPQIFTYQFFRKFMKILICQNFPWLTWTFSWFWLRVSA